jgi:photosystem II stability/assembly factor-like uncharacterized protein
MKRLILVILSASFISSLAFADVGSWSKIGGPAGGIVKVILRDTQNSDILYAGTFGGGVYKSFDGGNTWQEANEGLLIPVINAMDINPQSPEILYAGTDIFTEDGGLYKSTNGGTSWTHVTSLPFTPGYYVINAVAIDKLHPETLYVASHFSGGGSMIVKSMDEGVSWILTNYPGYSVWCLTVDPINTNIVYAGISGGVAKSVDGGINWQIHFFGNRTYSIAVDSSNNDVIYAGTTVGLYKSVDAGSTWNLIKEGETANVTIDPDDPFHVFQGTWGDGIFESIDAGSSWTQLEIETPIGRYIWDIELDLPKIYGGLGGGVIRSEDNGISWEVANSGIEAAVVISLLPTDDALYAGTWFNGLFRKDYGSNQWINIGLPESVIRENWIRAILRDPVNPQHMLVGISGSGLGFYLAGLLQDSVPPIYRTEDGGVTWISSDSGIFLPSVAYGEHYMISLVVDPENTNHIFAGGGPGLYISHDAGLHWTYWLPVGTFGGRILDIVFHPYSSDTIYIGGEGPYLGAVIHKSLDNGQNWEHYWWTSHSPPLNSDGILTCQVINPENPEIQYGGLASPFAQGIVKTENDWQTYTVVLEGVGGSDNKSIIDMELSPIDPDVIYAGGHCILWLGVFKSSDAGGSWDLINDELENFGITSLVVSEEDTRTLYAGTYGGGVCEYTDTTITGVKENFIKVVPQETHILQVSPNPFSLKTEIQYSVTKKEFVSIRIFDVSGRLARTLVSELKNSGLHIVFWDGRDNTGKLLPSGVYFVRLETPNKSITKKIIKLK